VVKPDIFDADGSPFFYFGDTTQTERYAAYLESDGDIRIVVKENTNDWREHITTTTPMSVLDVWYEVVITNSATAGWAVWVNATEHALTESTGTGTDPAADDFMNARSQSQTLQHRFFDQSTSAPVRDWTGDVEQFGVSLTRWTDDEIVLHYASGLRGFQDFTDIMLDDNPENFFRVDDNTAVDLRGGITGAATATGTFVTDPEEVPLAWDDPHKPQRFGGTHDLAYGTQAIDSKGTGVLQNFSFIVVGQILDVAADMTIFANYNNADAVTDSNFRLIYDQSAGGLAFESLNGGVLIAGPAVGDNDVFCVGLVETDAATDEWDWWEDAKRESQVLTNNAYAGAASDRFRIGARGTQDQDFDGNPQYIATYDRAIDPRIMRRVQLAYRGFRGQMLEIHRHIDAAAPTSQKGFIFPLDERDPATWQAENWVINDATIQNMSLQSTGHTAPRIKGGSEGLFRATQLASGTYLESTSPAFADATYPFTMGGKFRADTAGNDALVALSNAAETDEYIAFGIIDGNPSIRLALGTTFVDEDSTTVVTQGELVDIAVKFVSDTDRKLYVNGALDTSFTTSRNVDGLLTAFTSQSANRIVGPDTDVAGTYQMWWGVQADLSDEEIMKIYSEGRAPAWQQITAFDELGASGKSPVAQWYLNEFVDSLADTVFRDRVNDDYNAVGTGVVHGAIGILPNRPDLCVDFDGTGNIDTGFTGYQTSSNARAFECWLEAGFTGTVCSMGANVDAQAVVISVDGSGDVSVHIRGTGNERIWTTALDTGTENHLVVTLPAVGSLHDFNIFINGVEETTIGTAGTDTTLATIATHNFEIGSDVTDIGKADATGKLYGMTVYNVELVLADCALRNTAGRAVDSGVHV
jgi:hypothetical protein